MISHYLGVAEPLELPVDVFDNELANVMKLIKLQTGAASSPREQFEEKARAAKSERLRSPFWID